MSDQYPPYDGPMGVFEGMFDDDDIPCGPNCTFMHEHDLTVEDRMYDDGGISDLLGDPKEWETAEDQMGAENFDQHIDTMYRNAGVKKVLVIDDVDLCMQ